ncbi:MAG: N-glycosylase/DNA lyase [Candidatus Korarchaeota archaeon]
MNGIEELVNEINKLKNDPLVSRMVNSRIQEFRAVNKSDAILLFKELCFCILTANFNAEKSIHMQKIIDDGFINLPMEKLAQELQRLGHRYPMARAQYIVAAREFINLLPKIISNYIDSPLKLRDWLAEKIKGIGYKEASHFMRNIGIFDVAIIDYHILDLLARYKIIESATKLTRRRYLEIENTLRDIAREVKTSLGELDLYLWYLETKKILK